MQPKPFGVRTSDEAKIDILTQPNPFIRHLAPPRS